MLYTLETFAEFTFNDSILINHSETFVQYFNRYLQDADVEVKIEAASSFTNFLSFINEEKYIMKYQQGFPVLINILIEAVKSDVERGLKMVVSIDSLVKSHPKFVRDSLDTLLDVFTEMAREKSLSSGLRNSALLTLVSLATTNSAAIKKSAKFINMTIPTLFAIIAEQPDDLTEWLRSEDNHELSSQSVQATCIENFSRLNEALGSKFMLQNTIKLAFMSISSGSWKEKYAGLMALAMLFEGSKKHFESELRNFIELLVPTLSFANPKVLYASMTCIALLTSEFSPELQTEFHASILPPVIHILQAAPEDKLKLRAISCMINFFRELLEVDEEDREFLDKYTEPVMESLISLFELSLQKGQMAIVEEIVSLISILAAIRAEKFSAYYTRLMPGLKSIVFNTPNDTEANNKVRALTISTLGYVLASHRANPQAIEADIVEIIQYLVGLQKTLAADDGQHKSILEVYEVMVGALKEKFLPFIEPVIEQTIQCAKRDINFVVEDHLGGAASGKTEKGDKQVMIDLKILGGQKLISMNHNNLEQKVVAFDMMRQLAKVLGKHLRPHLTQLSTLIFEHLDYTFSSIIREHCAKSLKHLMGVCTLEKEAQELFELFAPKLLKTAEQFLKIENDEKSYLILKNLKASAEQLKTSQLKEEIVAQWFNVLKASLLVCKNRKEEILKEYDGNVAGLDEEQREDFETEFATPNMLMHNVMDTAALLLKHYKSKYEKVIVDELGYYFYQKSKEFHVEDELHYATCFYAELFNNCSQTYVDQGYQIVLDTVLPPLSKTEDTNFQQTGSFLLGVLAKKCNRLQFSPYLEASLALLTRYLGEPDAQSEDKKVRTETVLGAFGKICKLR